MGTPWEKLLQQPHPGDHFVQLYNTEEAALKLNVGHYLWEGLRRGEGSLLIATPEHRQIFSRQLELLGAGIPELLSTRQLVLWDVNDTLAELMVGGQPDWSLFERTIRTALRQVQPRGGGERLRAYGEMVGVLWRARRFAAAIRLEQLWNRLLEQLPFSLYCAYGIDVFGEEFAVSNLDGVLCTHTHLLPAQPDDTLATALYRSMDEILGREAVPLRARIKASYRPSWAVMPAAENILLWLRQNLPGQADTIVQRARDHYHFPSSTYPADAVHSG